MSKRINIDGVWYVREESLPHMAKPIPVEYIFSEECVVETELYCWEASRLKKGDDTFYDSIDIKVTIKKGGKENWEEDYWDNVGWFIGVLNNNKDSLDILVESVPEPEQREVFINLLKKLVEINWLNLD